jgi:threonine/homoserine/homoserine lactone efflux protein
LIGYIIACIAIELTPGPNMTWLAILSVASGRRAGLMATAGVAAGLLSIGLAAAFGAAAAISASPVAYSILRWAGVAYLLYLAVLIWRGNDAVEDVSGANDAAWFRMGLIANILNPKAALFYLTVPPQFISPDGQTLASLVILTFIYVAIATAIHLAIVMFASTAGRWLTSSQNVDTVRKTMAVLLACVAVWLIYSTALP